MARFEAFIQGIRENPAEREIRRALVENGNNAVTKVDQDGRLGGCLHIEAEKLVLLEEAKRNGLRITFAGRVARAMKAAWEGKAPVEQKPPHPLEAKIARSTLAKFTMGEMYPDQFGARTEKISSKEFN